MLRSVKVEAGTFPFRYVNPRPAPDLTEDCTVRAVCVALGCSYGQAEGVLRVNGRRHNRAMPTRNFVQALRDMRGLHNVRMKPCTLAKFLRLYPQGVYLIRKYKHCFAVVDGVVCDLHEAPADCWILDAWKKV